MYIAKTLQKGKKVIGLLMFVGFLLAGVVTPPTYATDLNLNVSFGPGTPRPSSHSRTLTVPGHTLVSVSGSLNPLPVSTGGIVAAVPVVIEVFSPENPPPAAPVASINTAAVALVSVPFIFALPPTFISDFGCPRFWRVRVRTANGAAPLVTVSGAISYNFFVPGAIPNPLPATYSVDMEGPSLHLEGGGASTTPTLAGHDPLLAGVANRSLIQGTEGRFNIRAKWDTAFHVCYLNQIFPLNVALRRSNGTTAANQTRFSQTSSSTNKVNFNYVVTPADALLPGPWRLRVNNNSVPCGFGTVPVAIDNFDVENLLPPNFQSTFTPRCSEAVGSSDLIPLDATVAVREPLNYAFSWTVPEGQNWHHLESMVLHIRDEEKTIISVLFDEPSNTFSLWNETKGKFTKSFAPGSRKRLQTPQATLHLADTSVVADGPTSTTVTLNLTLSFKPRVAGHTFVVEVAATDKDNEGNLPEFFDQVGTLTVTP
jgi:hypothetical protein